MKIVLFYQALNMYCAEQFICINLLKRHTYFMKLMPFFLPFADIVTEAQRSSKLVQGDNKLVDGGTAWESVVLGPSS